MEGAVTPEAMENLLQLFIGKYGMFIIVFMVGIIFKDTVNNFIDGLAFVVGNDFNPDDVIFINGRKARIVRIGLRKSIFYMFDKETKLVIENERIKEFMMEKEIPKA